MPQRIQRKRTKGWKLPPNAVYVGRPTIWGNPFAISETVTREKCIRLYRAWISGGTFTEKAIEKIIGQGVKCPAQPLALFQYLAGRGALRHRFAELRGKDLACWCPLNKPCHADVLLEIVNIEDAA
jgi:hypothetical protein